MVVTRGQQRSGGPAQPLALLDALLASNPSRAKLLLQQDPSRALAGGPSGFTCLHAATLVDASRLVAPLVAAGLSPDVQIEALDGPAAFGLRHFLRDRSQGRLPSSRLCAVFRGVTPLHIACWLGHAASVQALLEAGANPEVACLEGRTSLAIACYFLDCRPKRSLAIIEALLAAGADPLCADFHGIGSLVLSPHCPSPIQGLLLDRVLQQFGGRPSSSSAAAAEGAGGSSSAGGGGTEGASEASGSGSEASGSGSGSGSGERGPCGSTMGTQPCSSAHAGVAAAPAAAGEEGGQGQAAPGLAAAEEQGGLPGLHLLTPDKHVDVLQASLVAKHRPAFDFFLAAASPEVDYPPHSVNRILSLAILSGDTALVRRILRSGLRPDPGGNNSQGHPHVAVAAVAGHEEVLDVLCAHGGGVSLKAVHHAIDTRSLQGLQLLLARGRPPVLSEDGPVHIGGAHSRSGELCVMLRLLRDTAFRLRYCYRVDMPRHSYDSLQMVEALAGAGYRPTRYPLAVVHNGWIDLHGRVVSDYDPTADRPAAFDLQGVNRFSWLAAKQEPWSWQQHCRWPARFKAAVRTLLLAYHTGRVFMPATALGAAAADAAGGPMTRAQKRARLDLTQQLQAKARAAAAAAAAAAARRGQQRRAGKRGRGQDSSPSSAQHPAAAAGTERVGGSDGDGFAGSAGSGDAGAGAAAVAGGPRSVLLRRPALATLPTELLMHIIGLAAYPVSAWI